MDGNDSLCIIHGDMDAFYAAVEQRDNPSLQGRPVIIGGDPNSRGVVSTCSYEARRFGVKSAMPLAQARRLCPQAVFLPVNMKLYQQVSRQVMSIMADYTPILQPLSIDEAFLDVSGCETLFGSALTIAREIKERVLAEHGLKISMGISYNMFLAKLATELGKPDGLYVIKRPEAVDLLSSLPVSYLWGVGNKTQQVLARMGIKTIGELGDTPLSVLEKHLGSAAQFYLDLARGIDHRQVEPERGCKSMGKEITFNQDLDDTDYLSTVLLDFAGQLARRLRRSEIQARTVTLKVKYQDFRSVTRSQTLSAATHSELVIHRAAQEMLEKLNLRKQKIRLIGISLSNLGSMETQEQGQLFEQETNLEQPQLDEALDQIRDRFGERIITRASLLNGDK